MVAAKNSRIGSNREVSEFSQRNKSLIADLPEIEVDGTRTVSPREAELLASGGERTQDELQNFGGFDPKTGRTKDYGAAAEEQANARFQVGVIQTYSLDLTAIWDVK